MYRLLSAITLAACLASSAPASADATGTGESLELESTSQGGRTALVLGQAAHGLVLGGELWWLSYDDPLADSSPGVATIMGLGGAAAGITTALLLTPNGIDRGHAALLNTGPLWGGVAAFAASRAHYGIGPRGRVGFAVLGQGVGLGLGHLAWKLFEPTYVQTWIVDSTVFWTTLLLTTGAVAVDPFDFPPRRPILAGLHVWGITGGLIAGGLLAAIAPEMRGSRLAALHLGGVLGGLAGLGLGGIAAPGRGAAWGFTLGAPIGIATAALLTHRQPSTENETALSFGMTEFDDGTRGLSIGGVF